MIRSGRIRQALAGALLLAAGACSSSELARYFDDGEYARVIATYEADPDRTADEQSLFMAGVSYAVTDRDARDLARGKALLSQLLERYPDTKYRQEASWLLASIDRQEELSARLAELSTTLEELKAVDVGRAGDPGAAGSSRFNRLFEEGDYAGVVRAFEADPSLRSSEHALFRAAVAYAVPDQPRHDPNRARQLFGLLLTQYPETAYRDDAVWFRSLMNQEIDLRRRIRDLEEELESLKAVDLGATPDGAGS